MKCKPENKFGLLFNLSIEYLQRLNALYKTKVILQLLLMVTFSIGEKLL